MSQKYVKICKIKMKPDLQPINPLFRHFVLINNCLFCISDLIFYLKKYCYFHFFFNFHWYSLDLDLYCLSHSKDIFIIIDVMIVSGEIWLLFWYKYVLFHILNLMPDNFFFKQYPHWPLLDNISFIYVYVMATS